MKIKKTVALCMSFFAGVAASQASLADEVWNSSYGKVVYEADIGKIALSPCVRIVVAYKHIKRQQNVHPRI
jgi:hypothetical protein